MRRPRIVLAALLAILAALVVTPVAGQTKGAAPSDPALVAKIRASNAECYACHSEAGLGEQSRKSPPRADLDLAKLRAFIHDPKQFDGSNHAGMECRICHGQGYVAFPHAPEAKAQISECGECHASKSLRVEQQFEASVHAKNLKDKFTCTTCHNPHVYRVAAKLGDPKKIVRQDNQMCVDCHNSDLRWAAFSKSLTPSKPRPDLDALHDWLPNVRLHWAAVRCVECHTPASSVKSLGISHQIQAKDKAEKNCVACHSQQAQLAARLYRYAAETGAGDLGFSNPNMLGSAYVVGATRNPALDRIIGALLLLTTLGVLAHGALRALAALKRRRSS